MKMGELHEGVLDDRLNGGALSAHKPGFARALAEARRGRGLSLRELGRQAGCAWSYLSMLEGGQRGEPGAEMVSALERALGLERGELVRRAARLEIRGMTALDEAYRSGRLSRIAATLSAGEVEGVREAMGDVQRVGREVLGHQVPLINCVAAGEPTEFTDLGYPARVADEYVMSPRLDDADAFAARVVGDSMEPDYRAGDVVVFSPARAVKDGMDCFVRLEPYHETTFKRVRLVRSGGVGGEGEGEVTHIRLEPRNERYQVRVVEREQVAGMYAAVSVMRMV